LEPIISIFRLILQIFEIRQGPWIWWKARL